MQSAAGKVRSNWGAKENVVMNIVKRPKWWQRMAENRKACDCCQEPNLNKSLRAAEAEKGDARGPICNDHLAC